MNEKPTYEELERRVQELEKIESENKSSSKEALRESENLFRLLYEKAPLGYQSLDENGHFIVVNKTWLDTLGYTKEEVIGKSFADFLHPDCRDHFKENFPRFKAIGEILGVEFEMVKKKGDPILVSFTGKISRDEKGNFQQTHCIFHDITERKQAEKELFFKKNIIKASSCAVSTCDLEGNMTYGNPFFQKQWGFDNPGEFLGKPFQKLWLIEDQKETIMKTLESKGTWAGELKGIKKDGSLFDVQVSAATVLDDTGNPIALTSTSVDITERKWAEEVLRESDERRRLFLEHVPSLAIQGYTSDGITIYWNHASETLYGYPACEAIGKSIFDLIIPPEMKTEVQSAISQMMATGEPIPSGELNLKRKDGSYVSVYSGHAMVHVPGKEPQFFCMDFDLTERKANEAKFQQLQKVESLSRMAGAIAHNFNNQLQIVIGSLEIAMDDLPQALDPNKNIVTAMKAAQKAAEVSRQMLIYLGQTSGKHEPIDLSGACRQSLSLIEAAIPKGIILNVDFPGSGPVIRAEKGRVYEILTHLITNAWESISDNRGAISLAVRTVTQEKIPSLKRFPIDWQPQRIPYACLEVSDTGCGIPNEDIEKLFDPFFTTKFTGRGMGLSVVVGIVRAQGGCITVDSQPGSGSVFRIYLPISTEIIPLEQEKTAAAPARKIKKGGTVLLIEDEEMIRCMTKTRLIRLGYKVIEAQDGVEAVEMFQQCRNEIRCVLSDLTMPRMNGWETLTELRKMSANVPVIMASGHDKDVVMADNHPEQPQVFLKKPYLMSELKEALAKAMTVW